MTMLRLRPEQLEALQAAADAQLSARLRDAVVRHWPDVHARLGDAGVATLVDDALAACRCRGITEEGHFGRYLNVACALGERFEDDPRYPWARRVFDDPLLGPDARIARLSALAKKALDEST